MRRTILITRASSGTGLAPANYFAKKNWLVFAVNETAARAIPPEKVAEKIFVAATDKKEKLRYPEGNNQSIMLFKLRKILPLKLCIKLIINRIEK
jgi:NAD(P)-dependent dehydrogenase (short-subunit alcohol dehydrogenase family)